MRTHARTHTHMHIYPLALGLPSHPCPIPALSVITEHRAELSSLHYTAASHQLPVSHMAVYTCQRVSRNLRPLSILSVFPSSFSTSVSLFLLYKRIHQDHFSRFHVYASIYDICFSLSDLLHLCMTDSRFINKGTVNCLSPKGKTCCAWKGEGLRIRARRDNHYPKTSEMV